MRDHALAALIGGVLLCGPAVASQTTVEQLTGYVDDTTYPRFERFVTSHLDAVIGLKVAVKAGDGALFSAGTSGGTMFVIYRIKDAPDEIVATSGFDQQHGDYEFDGFYIVKSGGIHQGIVSYALEPVSEAVVRLNPSIRIKAVRLGR